MILTNEHIAEKRKRVHGTAAKDVDFLYGVESDYLDTIADLQRRLAEAQSQIANWRECFCEEHLKDAVAQAASADCVMCETETALMRLQAQLAPNPACPLKHPTMYWVEVSPEESELLRQGASVICHGYCQMCRNVDDAVADTITKLREQFRKAWPPTSSVGCPMCIYEDGVFKELCTAHDAVAKATGELREALAWTLEEVQGLYKFDNGTLYEYSCYHCSGPTTHSKAKFVHADECPYAKALAASSPAHPAVASTETKGSGNV